MKRVICRFFLVFSFSASKERITMPAKNKFLGSKGFATEVSRSDALYISSN
jgi:hypothetical protein